MKNFVKVLDEKGPAFTYLCGKFTSSTNEKEKAGVFIGPQTRQLFKDQQFEEALSDKEEAAWQSFEKGFGWFSGKFQKLQISEKLYKISWIGVNSWGCNMSLKMHFLFFTPGFLAVKLWCHE